MDHIILTGLAATGHHGVFEHERRNGQRFVVDVDLAVDMTAAAMSDDLSQTVDYSSVADEVLAVVTGTPRDLVETVAVEIADRLLAIPGVHEVEVVLHKPQAPLTVDFEDVMIRVRRSRA